MPNPRTPDLLLKLLTRRAVVDLPAIQAALGGVSEMTAFRYLRLVPYRRSYNHNGKYYTLHDPSRYDRFGLWSSGDIHFSAAGSLGETVRKLVHEAEAGLTHREVERRLSTRAQNTLLDLVQKGEIARERVDGTYVYLHVDPGVQAAQLERRGRPAVARNGSDRAKLDDIVVIQVLLALLRHPGDKAVDVTRRLVGHEPPIPHPQVLAVFALYDLDAIGEKGGPSNC